MTAKYGIDMQRKASMITILDYLTLHVTRIIGSCRNYPRSSDGDSRHMRDTCIMHVCNPYLYRVGNIFFKYWTKVSEVRRTQYIMYTSIIRTCKTNSYGEVKDKQSINTNLNELTIYHTAYIPSSKMNLLNCDFFLIETIEHINFFCHKYTISYCTYCPYFSQINKAHLNNENKRKTSDTNLSYYPF